MEPENRLVARGLESEWENRLRDLAMAENELRRPQKARKVEIPKGGGKMRQPSILILSHKAKLAESKRRD